MRLSFKEIIITAIVAFFAGFGVWYLQNIYDHSLVSGVVADTRSILKNTDGRTNVLLLGMGGDGHEGGDLTDSILFVSFDLATSTAVMTAIPRDVWVPQEKAKINSLYHYGGLKLSKLAIAQVLGIPIHYAVVLDFQGFVKAIDAIGGIDVEVEHTFDDYKYPIPGKEEVVPEEGRYEHVHFEQGMTHMDGATALQFARSRHALGEEGTDFARGLRQEKIILSFRSRLFSAGTIFSADKLTNLRESIVTSIDTDISGEEQGGFIKLLLSIGGTENVESFSLTEQFINPPISKEYGGQWVLVPKNSWEDIHTYVENQF